VAGFARGSAEAVSAAARQALDLFRTLTRVSDAAPFARPIYAPTSSVYDANTKLPFSVDDKTDHPMSLYARTKKAKEWMPNSWSHL
jgi:dTDP-4-dehydrorhamnose reductase